MNNRILRAATPGVPVLLMLAGLSGCGTQTVVETSPNDVPGCSMAISGIRESSNFTAYEDQMGGPALSPTAIPVAAVPATKQDKPPFLAELDGLRAQGSIADGNIVLYAAKPADRTTVGDVRRTGGLVLEDQGVFTDSYPQVLKQEFGDRVVLTQVGPFEAAINWADPDAQGTRAHYVSWTDDTRHTYVLSGVRAPEALLAVARRAVC